MGTFHKIEKETVNSEENEKEEEKKDEHEILYVTTKGMYIHLNYLYSYVCTPLYFIFFFHYPYSVHEWNFTFFYDNWI